MLCLKLRYIGPDDYVCEERYFDNSTTGEGKETISDFVQRPFGISSNNDISL